LVRNARFGPLLECGEESVLCNLLGHADIAHQACDAGDELGLLDPPDCIDGAIWIGGRHGRRSQHHRSGGARHSRGPYCLAVFLRMLRRVAASRLAGSGGKTSGEKSEASKIGRSPHSPLPSTSRKRLVQWIASSFDATWNRAWEAFSSWDSVKGPSITVNWPGASRTRLPFELGCSPSVASITPAFVISSMNSPILSMSLRLGGAPASELSSALSMPRIPIVLSPSGSGRDMLGAAGGDTPSQWSGQLSSLTSSRFARPTCGDAPPPR